MPRRSLPVAPLTLILTAACGERTQPPPPPAAVTVATVEQRDVPFQVEGTGTVEPEQTVRIQAQVTGTVVRVGFREGDQVRRGQLLFELDRRQWAAQLAAAEAVLARDQAQLRNARSILARNEELARSDNVAEQVLQDSRTQVAAMEATLAADSAALQQARLNIDFAMIRAPISGRAGGLLVRPGNLVRANAAEPLVVIHQLRPILVRFALPVAQLGPLRDLARMEPRVEVGLPDGTTREGKVIFLDNAVDTATGTVQLKARFANEDESFWPGQFLPVRLRLRVDRNAVVVPATAVVPGQDGSYLFVLRNDSTVTIRNVEVARSTGREAIIRQGVEPGEVVVTDGQIRLRDGARVAVSGPSSRASLGADAPAGDAP